MNLPILIIVISSISIGLLFYIILLYFRKSKKQKLIVKSTVKSMFKNKGILSLIFALYIVLFGFLGAYSLAISKTEEALNKLVIDKNALHSSIEIEHIDNESEWEYVVEEYWVILTDQEESSIVKGPTGGEYNLDTLEEYLSSFSNTTYGYRGWWANISPSFYSGRLFFEYIEYYVVYIVLNELYDNGIHSSYNLNETTQEYDISYNYSLYATLPVLFSNNLTESYIFSSINNYNPLTGEEFNTVTEYEESIENETNGLIGSNNGNHVNDYIFVQDDALSNLLGEPDNANGTKNNPYYIVVLNDSIGYMRHQRDWISPYDGSVIKQEGELVEIGDVVTYTSTGLFQFTQSYKIVGTFYSPDYAFPYQEGGDYIVDMSYHSVFLMNTLSYIETTEEWRSLSNLGNPFSANTFERHVHYTYGYDDIYAEAEDYKQYVGNYGGQNYVNEINKRNSYFINYLDEELNLVFEESNLGNANSGPILRTNVALTNAYNSNLVVFISSIIFFFFIFLILIVYITRKYKEHHIDVGSLKSLGFSQQEILPMLMIYPIILVVIGTFLAIVLAFPLSNIFLSFILGAQFALPIYLTKTFYFAVLIKIFLVPLFLILTYSFVYAFTFISKDSLSLLKNEFKNRPNFVIRSMNKREIDNLFVSYSLKGIFKQTGKLALVFIFLSTSIFLLVFTINGTTFNNNLNTSINQSISYDYYQNNYYDENTNYYNLDGDDIDEHLARYDLGLNPSEIYFTDFQDDPSLKHVEGSVLTKILTDQVIDYINGPNGNSFYDKDTGEFVAYLPWESIFTIFVYSIFIFLDDLEDANFDGIITRKTIFTDFTEFLDVIIYTEPDTGREITMSVLITINYKWVFQQLYYINKSFDLPMGFVSTLVFDFETNYFDFSEWIKIFDDLGVEKEDIQLPDFTFNDIYYDSNFEIPFWTYTIDNYNNILNTSNVQFDIFATDNLDNASKALGVDREESAKIENYQGDKIPIILTYSTLEILNTTLLSYDEGTIGTISNGYTVGSTFTRQVNTYGFEEHPTILEFEIVGIIEDNILSFAVTDKYMIEESINNENSEISGSHSPSNFVFFNEFNSNVYKRTANNIYVNQVGHMEGEALYPSSWLENESGTKLGLIFNNTLVYAPSDVLVSQYSYLYDLLGTILVALSVFCVVVVSIIMLILIKEIIVSSKKEVALLKSFGYSNWRASGLVLFPYIFISLITILVMLPISAIIFGAVSGYLSYTLGFYLFSSVGISKSTLLTLLFIIFIGLLFLYAIWEFGKNDINTTIKLEEI